MDTSTNSVMGWGELVVREKLDPYRRAKRPKACVKMHVKNQICRGEKREKNSNDLKNMQSCQLNHSTQKIRKYNFSTKTFLSKNTKIFYIMYCLELIYMCLEL